MDPPTASIRGAYGVVGIGTAAYACLTFVWFSVSVYLTTIIEVVGLTSTEAGLLVGAIPLTYIVMSLLTGIVIDRVGPGPSLSAGILIVGLGQIGRSAAPGFPSLFLSTLFIGVGATAITFGLPKLVSFLFPPTETGTPSAVYLFGSTFGSALVFGAGRSTIGPWLGGWRPLLLWSGVVTVAVAVVWFAVARRVGLDGGTTEEASSFSVRSITGDLGLVLSHRELQLLVVVGTMFLLVNHGVQGWLPTVLEARGFSAALAGQTTSLYVLALATGTLAVPILADRFGMRYVALLCCGVLIFVGGSGMAVGAVALVLFACIVATGVGVGGISSLVRAMPPEFDGIGPQHTGTAVAYVFAVGEIGGFLGPVFIGTLHGVTGSYVPGMLILGVAGLVTVAVAAALRRMTVDGAVPGRA